MRTQRWWSAGCVLALLVISGGNAEAQLLQRLKEKVKERAEQAGERTIDKSLDKLENAIRCAAGDEECIAQARQEGKKVMLTDDDGNPLPANQQPDLQETPAQAPAAAAAKAPKLGEGAWANFDFVPGERILFTDDFSSERVGNFPRRLEFIEGSMELVEWQGKRLIRTTSDGAFAVPLPEALPERFTLEFDTNLMGNWGVRIISVGPDQGKAVEWNGTANGSHLKCGFVMAAQDLVGLIRNEDGDTRTAAAVPEHGNNYDPAERLYRVRVHADGRYFKVYLDDRRVANVPNFDFCRGTNVYFEVNGTGPEAPAYVGNITIAAGGREMYDALMADGRIVTQGILFDTNSDVIRGESSGTLREIVRMLQEHPELRIRIEGHTDNVGDDAANLDLSKRRAAAVKNYLTSQGIAADRLESEGLGESKPAASNDTPEGRQSNRRVELVKL